MVSSALQSIEEARGWLRMQIDNRLFIGAFGESDFAIFGPSSDAGRLRYLRSEMRYLPKLLLIVTGLVPRDTRVLGRRLPLSEAQVHSIVSAPRTASGEGPLQLDEPDPGTDDRVLLSAIAESFIGSWSVVTTVGSDVREMSVLDTRLSWWRISAAEGGCELVSVDASHTLVDLIEMFVGEQ